MHKAALTPKAHTVAIAVDTRDIHIDFLFCLAKLEKNIKSIIHITSIFITIHRQVGYAKQKHKKDKTLRIILTSYVEPLAL